MNASYSPSESMALSFRAPVVPGYRIGDLLGSGSGGQVWGAICDETGEQVAIKWLPREAPLSDRERLRREAALLATLRHPNVVRLRGVLGVDDGVVLVLDLAAGGSLANLLAVRRRLTVAEVASCVQRVGAALAAAHTAGLIHGDVSPGNVLFTGAGVALLADLGTARLMGEAATPNYGTLGYVAPEVRAGGVPTPAADVYALAAVVARALTGQTAGADSDGAQRWAERAQGLDVPAGVIDSVCRGLSVDPDDRPSIVAFRQLFARDVCATPVQLALESSPGVVSLMGQSEFGASHCSPPERVAREAFYEAVTHQLSGRVSRSDPPATRSTLASFAALATVIGGFAARCRRFAAHLGKLPNNAARPVARRVLILVATVTLALGGGVAWRVISKPHHDRVAAGRSLHYSAVGSTQQWSAILTTLDNARATAFVTTDPGVLSHVYFPNSPAQRADADQIRTLAAARLTARGVRHRLQVVRAQPGGETKTTLTVHDRMGEYAIVAADGSVQQVIPAAKPRTVEMELRRERGPTTNIATGPNRWLIYEVRSA